MDRYDPPDHPIWHEMARRKELETENAQFLALVREMGKKMDYCADWFAPPGHGHQIADEIREILSRPEVRGIMKEEPDNATQQQ